MSEQVALAPPEWAAPGRPVVILQEPNYGPPYIQDTTVRKVNKRSVTVEYEGQRFPLRDYGATDRLTRYGAGGFSTSTYLLPPDAPVVARARQRRTLALARDKAATAAARVAAATTPPAAAVAARQAAAAFTAYADLLDQPDVSP